MNRRQFSLWLMGSAGVLAASGTVWLNIPASNASLTIDETIETLRQLDVDHLQASGQWSAAQILRHLTQSVQYSLSGYPESKSAFFQHVVGKTAFSVFRQKRAMYHPLDEPIPGAPALSDLGSARAERDSLIETLRQFQAHDNTLAPHFAYGALSKDDYSLAHVLHIQQHLSQLSAA